jgi:azurin
MKAISNLSRAALYSVLVFGLIGAPGCEPGGDAGAPVPVDPEAAERESEALDDAVEAMEEDDEVAVFEITADDGMRFGLNAFEVTPGQRVAVLLENIGEMPVESMGHNFVLLALGTDLNAFANAAIPYEDNDYIPPEREDEVLAATRILGPGESERLTFTAPEIPGEYDYICTFPGHTAAGMAGVMTVRAEIDAEE